MANLLNLTDNDYRVASASISEGIGSPGGRVEKILRQYVDLGVNREVDDYPEANVTQQGQIAATVQAAVTSIFSTYTLGEVRNVLNEMAIEALNGLLDQRIAYPLKWNTQQQGAIATSHATSTPGTEAGKTVGDSVADVFGGIFGTLGKSVSALAASLGISPALLVLAIVALGFLVLRKTLAA